MERTRGTAATNISNGFWQGKSDPWTSIEAQVSDCGLGPLYRSLFKMNTHCEYCGLVYEREQGYFVGAIYFNIMAY
jgi:uncharacterized protein (DUF983 family)